jgi:hypothetical protein
MTPHGALEDMLKIETLLDDHLGEAFAPKVWPAVKDLLRSAVSFEYGQAAPAIEHTEFGNQMFDKELFRLPFPVVFMTAAVLPKTALLACEGQSSGKYCLDIITFGPVQIGADLAISAAPILWVRVRFNGDQPWIDWKSITVSGSHRSRTTGREWGEEDFTIACEKVIGFTLGGCALLMSKDVQTDVIAAPERLNQERKKKGREPIRERHVVRIRPEARQSQREAAESFRSSPRLHWRRGHFRRVREDLIVPVAPAIIGAGEGVIPTVKKYEFGRPAAQRLRASA